MPRKKVEPIEVDPLVAAETSVALWQRQFDTNIELVLGGVARMQANLQWYRDHFAGQPDYLVDGMMRELIQFANDAHNDLSLPAFHLVAAKARLAALQEMAQKGETDA